MNFPYGVICKEVDGYVNVFFLSEKIAFRSLTMDTVAGANIGQFQHILLNVFVPVSIVCEK
jgi:hypothetical protein